jgi:hypothetical protein
MNDRILKALHELTAGNRDTVALAGGATCTKCGQHFGFRAEAEVIDDTALLGPDGFTVLCPYCGADAALPELTPQLLRAIHDHWHN